jgi:sialate O-acetylesterase
MLGILALAATAHTEPPALLHPIFQDHAVLQRDRPITVWGHAAGGEAVSVALGSASARVTADGSGRWSTILPPMSAGGPFVLTAQGSSGTRQAVSDILVGDVYLCSGQSNMELRVQEAGDSYNEIHHSSNDMIRLLNIAHAVSPTPLPAFKGPVAWQLAAPDTVPDWSAACFFFARELEQSVHVPIGLVQATWGGSNIRPWISAAALQAAGGYEHSLKTLALYARDENAAQRQFAAQWEEWWRGAAGERKGNEPWNLAPPTKATDTGDWREPPPALGDWRTWGMAALEDFTGSLWYRTTLSLTAAQAASATALSLGAINQVDETWINGHALGNTFGYGTDRLYSLPLGILHAGDNVLVINVSSTYGGGGLLNGGASRALHLAGGESIPLTGRWQFRTVPAAAGYPPRAPWESVGGLATLYNAMIAPLGAVVSRRVQYRRSANLSGAAHRHDGGLAAPVRTRPRLPHRAAAEFRHRAGNARGIGLGGGARSAKARGRGRCTCGPRSHHRHRRAPQSASGQQTRCGQTPGTRRGACDLRPRVCAIGAGGARGGTPRRPDRRAIHRCGTRTPGLQP